MPATKTAVPTPAQWTKDGPESPAEVAWRYALEAAEPMLPGDVYGRLVDAAAGRAIGAYDYGVAWGIGQLPEAETDAPTEVILAAVRSAMERITALTAVLDERVSA